jgi:hypothetical protein
MLRISKMPPCLASTRNSVLSLILGRHRGHHGHFVHRFADHLGAERQVDLDLRLPLLEQHLRRVRLFERQVLQVHALDLEQGGV